MFEITYLQMLIAITVIWVIARIIAGICSKKVSLKRELQLLMVYICIIVIARIVYFPWHHVNGHIDTLKYDSAKFPPPWVNFVPIVHLFEVYDGWQMNIFGNIALFIPVGIVWPVCFKKLDSVGKTILAGLAFTVLIEITQLPFYERCSDIDDVILNTLGVTIGALICFGCKRAFSKRSKASRNLCR